MKRRFLLLVAVIALIAGFGALLHSPPSIMDTVTGATPKAKKAAQTSAKLEGSYMFCINPSIDELSDKDVRNELKAFVLGKKNTININTEQTIYLYVSETDYALIRYADSLCSRLYNSGIDAKIKKYSNTMLRSRVAGGRYEIFLATKDAVSTDFLENADYIILDSSEMR